MEQNSGVSKKCSLYSIYTIQKGKVAMGSQEDRPVGFSKVNALGFYSMKFEKLSLDPTSIQGKKEHLTAEYKASMLMLPLRSKADYT